MKMLIFTVLIYAAALTISAAEGQPRIELDKTTHDFGKTSDVESVTGKFVYSNRGTAPLKLDKPTVSCGCTLVEMSPELLQPGEKGELSFTLELGKARANLVKHITVNSNDPERPKVELTIKAQHVPLYETTPSMLRVQVRQGESTNMAVRLGRTDGNELKISRIEASNPWITSQVEKTGAQTARITFQIAPDGVPRHLAESVQIFGENSSSPIASIFIGGRVVGEIVVSPETLYWTVNQPEALRKAGAQTPATKKLSVTSSRPEKAFQVHNISSSLKEITVELVPRQSGYDVVAKMVEVPKETLRGTITMESDLPGQPKLEIPVTVAVARRLAPAPAAAASNPPSK